MSAAHTIVVGLAFGDCGKGSLVDYLTRSIGARTVVRFNGGPQAGHNVVTPAGRHHTFSQFGSGTLAGARTLLSRFMLIERAITESRG
jgi:adenylosuccinate synthase